ncbi:hypothetical protein ABZ465_06710 [Streptomyces griseoincarnatus]
MRVRPGLRGQAAEADEDVPVEAGPAPSNGLAWPSLRGQATEADEDMPVEAGPAPSNGLAWPSLRS